MRNAAGASDHTASEDAAPTLVQVGRIGKPHSLDGTVKVIPTTDAPERFAAFRTVYIGRSPEQAAAHAVDDVRFQPHKKGTTVLLTLEAVADRTAAEALRRLAVYVPEEAFVLDDEEHFVHDLVGWAVCLNEGTPVGTLKAIMPLPGPDVLVIERENGTEAMVPFVEDFVPRIDADAQRIYIEPIEGLLDADAADEVPPAP